MSFPCPTLQTRVPVTRPLFLSRALKGAQNLQRLEHWGPSRQSLLWTRSCRSGMKPSPRPRASGCGPCDLQEAGSGGRVGHMQGQAACGGGPAAGGPGGETEAEAGGGSLGGGHAAAGEAAGPESAAERSQGRSGCPWGPWCSQEPLGPTGALVVRTRRRILGNCLYSLNLEASPLHTPVPSQYAPESCVAT
ncbi:uncharacterized protein LOC131423336 [Marmota monax]|uniref:uncharacterized protein LOC131423336 n=1 Tax=Marmota monax TaxID=9995 RepID=UPI0026EB64D1|nr:uncharacterized protein LOC131423336 [Marmota monax]